jgi:hypothetical protein
MRDVRQQNIITFYDRTIRNRKHHDTDPAMKLPSALILSTVFLSAYMLQCQQSSGGVLLQPYGIGTNMSTEFGHPLHAIDQSGLSINYISGVTDPDTYFPTHSNMEAEVWSTMDALPGYVVFDLGGTFTVTGMIAWNAWANGGGNVSEFSLQMSDTLDFSQSNIFIQSFIGRILEARFTFDAEQEGRYILMTIISNGGALRTRLDEIAFVQVPEPTTTLLLMLACVGCLYAKWTPATKYNAERAGAANPHACGTFVMPPAFSASRTGVMPKASGDT